MPIACRPPSIILFLTFALSLLVSISAPNVRTFDDVRTYFGDNGGNVGSSNVGVSGAVNQVRYGIWGYCQRQVTNGDWICNSAGVGYSYALQDPSGHAEYITASWTRGLVLSCCATGFAFITFLLSFSRHYFFTALMAWWSAFVDLLFMATNIALYVYVRKKMNHFDIPHNTDFGPGFWMSLAVFILLSMSGFAALVERRRSYGDLNEDYRYAQRPGIFGRVFRRK